MRLEVRYSDGDLQRITARLAAKGGDTTPLMQEVGEIAHSSIERNFAAEGRPERWKKSRRAEQRGGQTLSDTARLRRSFTVEAFEDSVEVGTNVEYAAAHQFGFRGRVSVRSHSRRSRGGSVQVRAHDRAVDIPARPFLMLQEDDKRRIADAAERFLGDD